MAYGAWLAPAPWPRALLECVGMSPWVAVVQSYTLVYLIRCTVSEPSDVLYRYRNRVDEVLIIEVLTVIPVLWIRKSGRPWYGFRAGCFIFPN